MYTIFWTIVVVILCIFLLIVAIYEIVSIIYEKDEWKEIAAEFSKVYMETIKLSGKMHHRCIHCWTIAEIDKPIPHTDYCPVTRYYKQCNKTKKDYDNF